MCIRCTRSQIYLIACSSTDQQISGTVRCGWTDVQPRTTYALRACHIGAPKSPSDDCILGSFSAVIIRPDPPCVPSGIQIPFLNPRIRIKMALHAPPPNISIGSERVLATNVRWGGGGDTPCPIPVRGLRAPGILGDQDERSKWGGRRTLDVSVPSTV